MRISDLSSNVYSSDLVAEAVDVALRGVVLELVRPFRGDLRRGHLDRADAGEQRFKVLAQLEFRPGLAIGRGDRRFVAATLDPPERSERASCRERVCQYV